MRMDGTDIKQILVGLRESQIAELETICAETHRPRSELIREAVDLLIRGYTRKQMKEVNDG